MAKTQDVVLAEKIESRIFLIRGHKVMLSTHLAALYGVEPRAVDNLFAAWRSVLKKDSEVRISGQPYLLDDAPLTVGAGIVQIRDFAKDEDDRTLLRDLKQIQESLKTAKRDFFELVTSKSGVNYFGLAAKRPVRTITIPSKIEPEKTRRRPIPVRLNRLPNRRPVAS